ncbi:hypothetical protein ABPG72_012158 [Tetrahymena utriculariae]
MKFYRNKILSIYLFIKIICQTYQQQNIIQSDKVFIKFEQQVWQSSLINSNQSKNYDFDISSAKFKNPPKIIYALTVYNSDDSSQQGFQLSTNTITQTNLNYKVKSLGCKINQIAFNILAVDDPNIEVQQKNLSSEITTTITGTSDIQYIAAFIYGFQGNSGSNLKLKYDLTQTDNRNYNISYTNSNIQSVYLNFVIVYKNSIQDMFQQLYSYEMVFDTKGQNIGGDNTVAWQTSTSMNSSPVFFGLKDFDISSGNKIFESTNFGIKIISGQTPEAQNKQIKLNYFTWGNYYVNLINGIWMGFSLITCQAGYTMFLNYTFNSCVQSCNTVDYHYNTNPLNTKLLYSTTLVLCQQCDNNCYGCKDGSPNYCTDCYNNLYLNPYTNTCDQTKPSSTYCQTQSVSGQTFQNCQKCDPTCKECSAAANSKSCISCNLSTQNKYLYQNKCLNQQPASTYCDSNLNCYDCDSNCASCTNSSNNCESCKPSNYLYQNMCLSVLCTQQNQYYNPFTNTCSSSQPSGTSCSSTSLQGQIFFICQKCDPSCKECSSPSNPNSCTLYDINSANKYFYNNQCQGQQPLSTYCDDNFICCKCDPNCSSCSKSSSNCQSCITNKYLYTNQCLDIACSNNEYLNNITKTCNQSKPSGTYCNPVSYNGNNFQYCQKCNPTCLECNPPGDSKSCISCEVSNTNKYYYQSQCLNYQPRLTYCDQNFQCFDCDKNCVSCSNSPKNCQSCISNIYHFQNQCLVNPLPGTYCTDYNNCFQCDKNCKTCIQNSKNCTTYEDQQYLYNKSCQTQKPSGVFCEYNQNYYVCQACTNLLCQECLKVDSSQCISCQQSQYLYKDNCFLSKPDSTYCLDNKCYDCDTQCSSCNGQSNNNFTQCKPNTNRSLSGNQCICNNGYYEDNSKNCQVCSSNCLTCNGPSDQQCLTCRNYIYQNICYENPPPGTYCDSQTKLCQECNSICQACSGPNSGNCTQCDSSKGLVLTSSNTCDCPVNQFLDNSGQTVQCKNCDSTCKTCNGPNKNNCLSCTYYMFNNQFYESQPSQTYCTKNTDCFKCQGDLILKPNNQLCQCPSGTYLDPAKQYKCSACAIQDCSKCQDSNSCNECGQSKTTNKKLYLIKNKCQEQYPSNSYCDQVNFVCQECKIKCQECDSTLLNCIRCQKDEYLYNNKCYSSKPNNAYCDVDNICKDCEKNCFNCSKNPRQCTECPKQQFLFNNKCYSCQPQGTSCKTNKQSSSDDTFNDCQLCNVNNCYTCNNSKDRCDKCIKGAQPDSKNEQCICPEGSYIQIFEDESKCIPCLQQNCSQCDKTLCIKCQSGFIFNDLRECVYCDNKMFANPAGICILPCKEGCKTCTSFDNCIQLDDTYKNCDVSCQTCTGPSISECASCSSNTRLFDSTNNTCKCITNFEEAGQTDCQYIYQVPTPIVNAQLAVGVAQFSIIAITTLTNFILGISYSLGLMQLLGNFYIRQDQTYSSEASVLSSYTKYNLNSLFQQKVLYPSSSTTQKVNRVLEQKFKEGIYPINNQEKELLLTDKIFYASNSIITLSLILLIYLVAQAFHQYQIRTKEHFKYMNIIRWNLVLFLIQISSNFMLITLLQCQIAIQRIIDWVFIGFFVIQYSFFIAYSFIRLFNNDHFDSDVSILSSGINQQHKFSRFYFVIFEVRKLIYCIIITASKQYLNNAIWSICVSQVLFILIAYKQQIFVNKLSNNVLISSEVIFLSIVSVLGVILNISDLNTQKTLAIAIVVLMMIYSIMTISVLIYILGKILIRKCSKREDLVKTIELSKLSAKIQLLNQSFEKNQKIKWSINPLKKKRLNESCNISNILDKSLSKKSFYNQYVAKTFIIYVRLIIIPGKDGKFALIYTQNNIVQSDRVLIKFEQQVWSSTSIGANQFKNYDFDISSGKFKNAPQIIYALTVYNAGVCSQQGFILTTINLAQTKLSYKLQSLGCELVQLGFNIVAIDDPNIEVQQQQLSSGVAKNITGTKDILQIAAFIYGFQGTSGSNLQLKYTLTKIDNRNYKIQFTNSNVPTVYLNFVIIYQNSSQDMLQQLYSYEMAFDTQGKNIGGDNTVPWTTSTKINKSPVFFGLKDFSISSNKYYGIKIQSGQTPEANNKQVVLNYFTWNQYYVNMINGIWMGFSLVTCQTGYTMFLNSTYNSCVKSCNSVDHHYNNNPTNTISLYSSSINLCQQCNDNCFGCKDGNPSVCSDCYNNMYLNPFTNTCDQQKPASTFCQAQTVYNQIFQNCQKCDPSCKECSSANNPKSCISCNLNSQNKYYYQNQCLPSQPSSTYCDGNFICQNCDPYCASCSNSSNNCQSCKSNGYLYQNKCLANICPLNQYLNPYTNNCDQTQPSSTSCTQITLNTTFYYCQKCDPSCKECSIPESSSSCSLCDINSENKYFYNNECLSQQPPQTYCNDNFICNQCDSNCSSCSGSSSNCQSCVTNKYLYINQCLDIACSNNQYLNSLTKTCDQTKPTATYCTSVSQNDNNFYYCQKCDPSCQECETPGDLNSCTSCDVSSSNKYYYNKQCLPTQPLSTFCDLKFQCQDCDKNCLSCSGSSKNCQSCKNNIYLYQNQCYENPLPGTYCTSFTDCKQCDTSCKTCIQTSTYCTSCQDQYYLFNNSCQTQKPSGVYCEQNQNFFNCLACTNTLCQECQKNDLNKCISCLSGQFLYKDNCVQSQPDSTYCQDNKCYDCDTSCSSCNGPSKNNCTQCNPNQNRRLEENQCACNQGYYEDNSQTCQQCSSTCLTCNGPSDKECLTCINYIYQNTCYYNPPPGTYCDSQTKQCQKCDQTCQACNGPNNNNCTQCDTNNGLKLTLLNTCACPDNQFIDTSTGSIIQCKNCDNSCKTCSGPNNNNCLSCTNFLFNNQCYDFQPPQTYCDVQKICQQCSQGCNSCEDTKTCIDCIANFFLNSDNTCQKCYLNCLTCNGANLNQCLTCQNDLILKSDNSCGCNSGQFIDISNKNSIKCNKCDSTCLECQGSQPNQCLSCSKTSENKYLYKNQCYQNQPPATYCDPSNNICQDCQSPCSTCSGIGQSDCTACQAGYYLYSGKCLSSQPDKTYCDAQKLCKDCKSSCLACQNSPDCTSCPKDQFLFNSECFISQPSNTFCKNQDTFKICQNCQNGCKECSSAEQCTLCQEKSFLYKSQCQDNKPDNTYCIGNTCFDCNPSCSQCSGPKNTDCTKCQGDFNLDILSKMCKCPSNTYRDNSDLNNLYKCSNCPTGCSKCQDDLSCDECVFSSTTNQKLFLIDNQCKEQQPPNTYCDPINSVCQNCDFQQSPCQKCDKTLKNCISCQKGDYLYKNNCLPSKPDKGVYCDENNICKDCDLNCFNCSKTDRQCIECPKGQFLYDKKCFQDQPQGTSCSEIQLNSIKDTFQNCQACKASNCLVCNKSADKCDKCIEGSISDSNNLSCICREGSYIIKEDAQKNKCIECLQSNCSQCNKAHCIKCKSGYKFNDSGECVYCDNKMYADSLGICNLPCKQGCKTCTSSDSCIKFDDTYKNCDVSCQTCTGPSNSECASCSSLTRLFDSTSNTCKCFPNFEENGQADCQYVYQVPKPIANTQSAVGIAQFSITAVTTVTNFIPGISYSLGLMQLLGNFYIRQDQTYSSQASVLSSYTKYNLNSLFQQKLLYPSSDGSEKAKRILQQSSSENIYPINNSEKILILTDKIYFASNSIITLSLVILIFLVAQAMHQYQIRTKEHIKYMNIIRWNLILFLIQISSNFMLLTLYQCQVAEQRMIDWVFIGIFVIEYSFFISYSFMRVYKNDHLDSAVSILGSDINQEHKFTRFYFVIFELRKLIYIIIISGSKQYLNYEIWSICVSQFVFIYIAYKKQIFINKLSNNVLISSEVIFLSIVSVLGIMINMSDLNIQKSLAITIVVLMMIYSVMTISVLIYILVQIIRRKCGKREDQIKSTDLSKLSAKIQLFNQSFENNQKIKWSMNPLKRKRTTESSNISNILDKSLSNKQIKVLQV